MNFKYRKKVKQTLAAVLAVMLLTGCTRGLPMVSEVNETKGYTLPVFAISIHSLLFAVYFSMDNHGFSRFACKEYFNTPVSKCQ